MRKRKRPISENVTTAAIAASMAPFETETTPMSHKMNQGGAGVATKNPTNDQTGAASTNMTDMGKTWPRKQKNTGGQAAFEGGGEGRMHEDYTPEGIAAKIDDNGAPLQELFDAYARQSDMIALFEFREVCAAYDCDCPDERTLLQLMEANREFMFYEHEDAQGKYWTGKTIAEGEMPPQFREHVKGGDGSESDDDGNEDDGKKDKKKGKKPWEEGRQNRTPLNENWRYNPEFDEEFDTAGYEGPDDRQVPMDNEFMDQFAAVDSCPECGAEMDELGCMSCGYQPDDAGGMEGMDDLEEIDPMMFQGRMEGLRNDGNVIGEEEETCPECGGKVVNGKCECEEEEMHESRRRRGRTLTEHDRVAMDGPTGQGVVDRPNKVGAKSPDLPYTGTEHPEMGRTWPRSQKNTGGQEAFGNSSVAEPNDTVQTFLRSGNLGEKQKNTGGQWEQFEGFSWSDGGTLSGGAKQMYENLNRLAQHSRRVLAEYARQAQIYRHPGKYPMSYTISAGDYVQPKIRKNLVEALADAEELVQLVGPDQVSLEARFYNQDGNLLLKKLLPLVELKQRGPVVCEGKMLFRFPEIARDYADTLVENGKTCRAVTHNWGAAVTARLSYQDATTAFDLLKESFETDDSDAA